MKKTIILIFSLFFSKVLFSQNTFFPTSTPVYKAALSHDAKTIAFADFEQVYVMDVESFTIKKQWKFDNKKKGIVSELFFHPSNSSLLNVRYSIYSNENMEFESSSYPHDSLFVYNLNSGTHVSLPGNMFVAFESNTENSIVAYNSYMSTDCMWRTTYSDFPCYYAYKGAFVFYPEQKEIPSKGIISSIKTNYSNSAVAIIYYDSLSSKGSMFTLELRNLPDFSIVSSKSEILEKPRNLSFSKDGKFIYFETQKSTNVTQYILNANDLSEVKSEDLITIKPFVWNNELIRLNGNEIENINFKTAKQNWKIWPNLTNLFSFNGVLAVNEELVFVFGQQTTGYTVQEQKGGIQKMNLADISAYSKNEEVFQVDTLFDPSAIAIQDNWLFRNKTYDSGYLEFVLTANEKYLLVNYGSTVQIWSAIERKKIHEFLFDNTVRAFPGSDESIMLVLEKYSQMQFDEYKIHIINLVTGIMRTKLVADRNWNDFGFDWSNCIPSTEHPNTWICNSGFPESWILSGDSLTVKKAISKIPDAIIGEREQIKSFSYVNGTNNYFFYTHDPYAAKKIDPQVKSINLKTFNISLHNVNGFNEKIYAINDTLIGYEKNKNFIIYDLVNKKETFFFALDKKTIRYVTANKTNIYLILNDDDNEYNRSDAVEFSIDSLVVVSNFIIPESEQYFALANGLIFSYSDRIFTYLFDQKTYVHWSSDEQDLAHATIDFDGKNLLLFANRTLIDLANLKSQDIVPKYYKAYLLKGKFTGNIIYAEIQADMANLNGKSLLNIYIAPANAYKNFSWKSETFELQNDLASGISDFIVSSMGNYAVGYRDASTFNYDQPLYLININTKKLIKLPKQFACTVYFSDDEKYLTVIDCKGKVNVYSTNDGSKSKDFKQLYKPVAGMPGKILLSSLKGISVNVADGDTVKQEKFYYSREGINTASFVISKNFLVGGGDKGNIYFWKPEILSPIMKINCGIDRIYKIIEQDKKLLVFLGTSLSIIDLDSMKLTLTLSIKDKHELNPVTWITPEGYFSSAKMDIKELHITKGMQVAPILSYEMFLNRPDIILERIGYADKKLIEAYKAAYIKRLKKNGFTENIKLSSLERPEISILEKVGLPITTKQNYVDLKFKAISETKEINRINILVNGVPIYGSTGLKISPTKDLVRTEKIKLHSGINTVQVSVVNVNGVESTPESYQVDFLETIVSKVYYIGIGVARYQNKKFNLQYAAKDAKDIESMIKNKYPDAEIHLLLDSLVTLENIRAIKKNILSKTSINDMVIVSFSGHGVIDNKLDFYYATQDIDFENPSKRGLLYSDIEWLVDSIPARKKLILVDACHSGEVDKEEVEQIARENVFQDGVQFRSSGDGIQNKIIGKKSTSSLMGELFSDLRAGTGATVISSSGAVEYSMESGEWKNGLFTYCFINGLKYREADLNQDGEIMLSELQQYLKTEVSKLSNGAQQPTSRMENTSMDFRIW